MSDASPRTETPPAPAPQPLCGVRVIDVGNFLAGPYAAAVMGEFGADVIKVEHPVGGDPMRRFGTATDRPDATLAWLSESRNKRSVTIDLLQPEGVQLFLKLIAKSDVLVENFRPGTMESWGLGWDALREANPKLVMLRVTGYGQTGPYRRRHGFAHIAQAFAGLNYLAGYPGETPVLPGTVPLGDYVASLFARSVSATMDQLKGAEPGSTAHEFFDTMTLNRAFDGQPPAKDFPVPTDIAHTCVFLSSDESAAFNGHDFEVTHGMRVRKESASTWVSPTAATVARTTGPTCCARRWRS